MTIHWPSGQTHSKFRCLWGHEFVLCAAHKKEITMGWPSVIGVSQKSKEMLEVWIQIHHAGYLARMLESYELPQPNVVG